MLDKQYSSSTQIVSDAANEAYWLREQMFPADADSIAAAALRAVAERILPKEVDPEGEWAEMDELRYQLHTIIMELEEAK